MSSLHFLHAEFTVGNPLQYVISKMYIVLYKNPVFVGILIDPKVAQAGTDYLHVKKTTFNVIKHESPKKDLEVGKRCVKQWTSGLKLFSAPAVPLTFTEWTPIFS